MSIIQKKQSQIFAWFMVSVGIIMLVGVGILINRSEVTDTFAIAVFSFIGGFHIAAGIKTLRGLRDLKGASE